MATDNELTTSDWNDILFPEGKERWIKIKVRDSAKCAEAFRMHGSFKTDLGYEVVSLSTNNIFNPQIEALKNIKEILENEIKRLEQYATLSEG